MVVGPGRTVGERLINDPRLALVSFTGSSEVRVFCVRAFCCVHARACLPCLLPLSLAVSYVVHRSGVVCSLVRHGGR